MQKPTLLFSLGLMIFLSTACVSSDISPPTSSFSKPQSTFQYLDSGLSPDQQRALRNIQHSRQYIREQQRRAMEKRQAEWDNWTRRARSLPAPELKDPPINFDVPAYP